MVEFIKALETQDSSLLCSVPKSDLHNHAALGSKLQDMQTAFGISIPSAPPFMNDIAEMNRYLHAFFKHVMSREGFEKSIVLAFQQAVKDGVTVLEMSMDCHFLLFYDKKMEDLIHFLQHTHQSIAPHICFRPEVGFSRSEPVEKMEYLLQPFIESHYFQCIDLYDDELAQDAKVFQNIYRKARQSGIKCKAHAGEFGDAESVRYTAEILELDAIQHGIAAAHSRGVMQWLEKNDITLNVCPTSNVRLRRVKNLQTHPARILFDNGVKITINSDDIAIFNQSVSEEYQNLYDARLFSAQELNTIREWGLDSE